MAHRLDTVIENGVKRILSHQQADGSFGYWCEVTPMSEAIMVIFLHLIGQSRHPIIRPLRASIAKRQQGDGAWTSYPDQTADISLTTLSYFALLLAGESKYAPHMKNAESVILIRGGLMQTSTFAKVLLATAGQLPWSVVPVPPRSMVSFDPTGPVSLFDVTAPTRIHVPSLLILSHRQYAVRLPSEVNLHHLIHPMHQPPKISFSYPNQSTMDRCKSFLLKRIEPDGTWAGYLSATVLAVLALRALNFKPGDPLLTKAIHGLMGLLITKSSHTQASPSMHQQFFTSTVWDTSLSMIALTNAGVSTDHPAMHQAASYLISKQHDRSSDWQYSNPSAMPGGWGFSRYNTLYPDVDDTLSALRALYPFQHKGAWQREWKRGASWLFSMQNDDGGWSAFDRNCNKSYVPLFAPNDLKNAVLDPSTPDITGRVLDMLRSTRMSASTRVIERAKAWLRNQQRQDGSWYGRWGITYIYGTAAVMQGLSRVDISPGHASLQKAAAWLEQIQNKDGGFGESCQSAEQKYYVPLETSTASQTAWALMGLCSVAKQPTVQIQRAVYYLLDSACADGGWREKYPTGSGVTGQVYLRYHSYPLVFPVMALSMVRRKFGNQW